MMRWRFAHAWLIAYASAAKPTTLQVATYNILDWGHEGLYSAVRALEAVNVDIAVVQETKFLNADFATKWWTGYEIKTAAVGTTSCGGVALLARKNELVLNKEERFFVVGCYFPPSDKHGRARHTTTDIFERQKSIL